MMHKDTIQLYELIVAMHEGDITDAQFAILNKKLQNKAFAREYVEFITIMSGLACPSEVDFYLDQTEFDELQDGGDQDRYIRLLGDLAEEEQTAPTIEIPMEKPRRELIQKVVYPPREKLKISKFQIITWVMSAAAILFFVLFLKFAPVRTEMAVAHVSRSVAAEWLSASGPISIGSELYPGSLTLKKGLAEITFNDGARVLLEAPVKFDLETPSRIYLEKGKLVANIEQSTEENFVVRTANSTVVDLGTEFGVEVDEKGRTNAHVFKGKVDLRLGSNPLKYAANLLLEAGQSGRAKRSGELVYIAAKPQRFLTRMPSSAYELAVKKTNPLYYWRFDRDQDGLLRNEMSSRFIKESELLGSVDYADGPDLGGGKNLALYFPGQQYGYAVLRRYEPEIDDGDSLSMAMWIRPQGDNIKRDCTILYINDNIAEGLGNRRQQMRFDYKRKIFKFFCKVRNPDGPQTKMIQIKSNPVRMDSWCHVVVTYTNKRQVNLYVNGQLQASEELQGAVKALRDFSQEEKLEWRIGSNMIASVNSFRGSVDEISQYNRELSADEVRILYEAVR